jgi:hypothetical protein
VDIPVGSPRGARVAMKKKEFRGTKKRSETLREGETLCETGRVCDSTANFLRVRPARVSEGNDGLTTV